MSKQPRQYLVRNTLRLSKLWASDYLSNIYPKNLLKLRFLIFLSRPRQYNLSAYEVRTSLGIIQRLIMSLTFSANISIPWTFFMSPTLTLQILFPLLRMPCLLMSNFYDPICSFVTTWSLLRCITLQPRFPQASTALGMLKTTHLPLYVPVFQLDFEHWRTRSFCEGLERWFRH